MSRFARTIRLAAVTALLAMPLPVAAQQAGPWEVGAGVLFDQYSFSADETGLESVSVVTVPFSGRAILGGGFDVRARGAWASGTVTPADGPDSEISGPTDTEVRLGWGTEGQGVRLEVVGYVPTGDPSFDADEAAVAGVVAADLLPFAVSNWGTGGGVALGLSAARRWGELGLGFGAAYRVSSEFDPLSGQDLTYEPGNELNVRAALDYTLAGSQKLSLSVGMRTYGEDVADGSEFLESGNRIEALASWGFPLSLRSAGALYGGVLHRERGTFLVADRTDLPSQNLLMLGGLVRVPFAGGVLSPRVDGRLLRRDSSGDGHLVNLGASFEARVGETMTLVPTASARFGSVDIASDESSGFNGFQAGMSVRFGPQGR